MRTPTVLFVMLSLSACWPEKPPEVLRLSGETMGTTYNVTVVGGPDTLDQSAVQSAIDTGLGRVNGSMNNWNPSSEVSRFNANETTEPVEISSDFSTVMAAANQINALSDGAFDVTLAPVIELWGFGPRRPESPVPTEEEIAAALETVGQSEKLSLDQNALSKSDPRVSINLAAIAKGYGVDAVAQEIAALGAENYLVEIGGDLVARGENAEGARWQIGIEQPDLGGAVVQQIVGVPDLGLATSGDYRNYFEQDGIRYSHIIDATTGAPVIHNTASVTVLAENAMLADGWATAFLALGSEDAMRIAQEQGLAIFAIDRSEGGFVTVASPAFEALLEDSD
ncbi:MAG: FAD:protein FMN transferase [Pseudomonadota bacterium]